jgi:aminoglycoside phosphotransferase (APT) family kinase protein
LRWYRADPISAIDEDIRNYLAGCRDIAELPLDIDACMRFWDSAMKIPEPSRDAAPCWVHADLLAENLLIQDGRLAAVLDFGELALGDPSVDLIAAGRSSAATIVTCFAQRWTSATSTGCAAGHGRSQSRS